MNLGTDVTGTLPSTSLSNQSITVNGATCTLGFACTLPGAGGVTTTGSPSSGQMAKFSGSATITNAVAGTDYAPPGAAIQQGSSTSVSTGQFAAFNSFIATAAITLTYPQSSTLSANGGSYLSAQGGAITVTPYSGDQICDPTCQTAGASVVISQGSLAILNTNATGELQLAIASTGIAPAGSSGDLQDNNGSGALAASHLNDNGTTVTMSESLDLQMNTQYWDLPNASATGTTLNKLAVFTGAPSTAVIATTSNTTGIIGIVAAGAGTTGNAKIAVSGQAACVFDGATTAGDFVIASTTTNGDCHDGTATDPTGVAVIGNVLSTNSGAGTYQVMLYPPNITALGTTGNSGGGSGGLKITGSPSNGELTQWSGAKSVTNGNLSGDIATSNSLVTTLATVNSNVGTFGSTTNCPTFTVNAKGLVTAASAAACAPPFSAITGTATSGQIPSDVAYYDKNQVWTASQASTPVTISLSSTTYTPNFNTGQNFTITFTTACNSNACTLANPSTTLVPGQSGVFEFIQPSSGGSSTGIGTWGSEYYYSGGTSTIAFSPGASDPDYFAYYIDANSHIVLSTAALNATH